MYALIKGGHIQAVRHGCLSLVVMASAHAYFASLPSITDVPISRTKGAARTIGPVGKGEGAS